MPHFARQFAAYWSPICHLLVCCRPLKRGRNRGSYNQTLHYQPFTKTAHFCAICGRGTGRSQIRYARIGCFVNYLDISSGVQEFQEFRSFRSSGVSGNDPHAAQAAAHLCGAVVDDVLTASADAAVGACGQLFELAQGERQAAVAAGLCRLFTHDSFTSFLLFDMTIRSFFW